LNVPLIDKSQKSLIHESRGLQCVTGRFASHVSPGQSVQLVIDDRHQPIARGLIALPPGHQQLSHTVLGSGIRFLLKVGLQIHGYERRDYTFEPLLTSRL
jgi:hypothetical protein